MICTTAGNYYDVKIFSTRTNEFLVLRASFYFFKTQMCVYILSSHAGRYEFNSELSIGELGASTTSGNCL